MYLDPAGEVLRGWFWLWFVGPGLTGWAWGAWVSHSRVQVGSVEHRCAEMFMSDEVCDFSVRKLSKGC